jgi:hypothetical protein
VLFAAPDSLEPLVLPEPPHAAKANSSIEANRVPTAFFILH